MRPTWLIGLLLSLLVFVSCAEIGGGAPTDDDGDQETAEPLRYVALGDSFSSGPLIPGARSDPGGCMRSTNNYPAYLAGWLGATTYVDRTCAGATTSNVLGPQRTLVGAPARVPPQIDAVTRRTDLVTVGIGGNDFGVFESMVRCFGNDPSLLSLCDPQTQQRVLQDAGRVEASVARVLRRVRRRAPDAEVLLVGYPRTMPGSGTCGSAGVPKTHAPWVRAVERALDDSLRGAAKQAGARFVGLADPSAGHDVCAGPRAWVNGWQFAAGQAAPFHPFREGMRGVAETVYQALRGEQPPGGQQADPDPVAVVTNQAAG